MIEISEVNYAPWGRCVRVSDGKNELFATLDFGPRIIRFSAVGRENMFFEDKNDVINANAFAKESAELFGSEKGVWHIRGGHRLWISPEYVPETYYPDNEPVSYEKIENGIRLFPPAQKGTNLQLSMEITMPEENCTHIIHKIENIGTNPTTIAPWALTVLSPGGEEIIPVPDREELVLENRHFVFWSYTKMNDYRITWGDKYIRLRQDPGATYKFKFGTLSQHGWAAYFNHGDCFVKYFDTAEDRPHPDRNCNFETFTSAPMLEMESIGVLTELNPGDSVSHSECWSYYTDIALPATDEETDEFVKKIVE